MSLTLTPDLDRETIASALGRTVDRHSVRTGEHRRRRLQKNVRRLSRAWATRVEIDEDVHTTNLEAEGTGDEVEYTVTITGRRVPQPVTDYEPRAWDWLVQRALGVHEAGHIRYTDYADWEDRLTALETSDVGVAHTLHNPLEDAAVETQIATRWPNYEDPLRALRANLLEHATIGIPDPERGGFLYPVAHAVHATVLEIWLQEVYALEMGVLDSLLDPTDSTHHFTPGTEDDALFRREIVGLCYQAVRDVLSTPDGTARNAVIFEFVQQILEVLDRATEDGRSQQNGRAGEGETGEGMPDDSRDNDSGEQTDNAAALADPEATDIEPADGGPGGSDLDRTDALEVAEDLQTQAIEEAADDARAEAGLSEAYLDELEAFTDALGADGETPGDGLRSLDLVVPTDSWEADPDLLAQVRTDSKRLARIFRQRLQHERRTAIRRGTRRGRLDPQRLHRTGVEPMPSELKRRRVEPDEKDYHMAFVLDRSASMRRKIRQAELALGLLLYALEEVAVETMVLELYDSQVRLAKPFGVSPESQRDRLFHGRTAGGTPLSTVLHIVRQRLQHKSPQHTQMAMFVITDDEPADPQAFARTIEATTFPVLGVNLATEPSTGTYTRSIAAEPGADLQEKLRQLATEVLL